MATPLTIVVYRLCKLTFEVEIDKTELVFLLVESTVAAPVPIVKLYLFLVVVLVVFMLSSVVVMSITVEIPVVGIVTFK